MHILVTGGAGFIGSHLVQWLVGQGHEVRVLDNLSTGRWENLGPAQAQVRPVEGDICDLATVRAATDGVDLVFHLAALVSVQESTEHPLRAHAVNATGSLHVLEAARAARVRRVVQMSSSAVYGDTERLPVGEDTMPAPPSPYAATKLAAEHYGTMYTHLYGLEVVALRGFNIYGPRQDPASPYAAVIPKFVAALRAGQQPAIFGDGLQTRDFIFVGDVVRALWTAATAAGLAGAVFNVGRGEAVSVLELARILSELIGTPVHPHFAPARPGEVRHSRADVSRFASLAGFRAQVGVREGLRAVLEDITE
ncbi:MAG: NAD-dependent epimerase/dehydratase family protein [Chloroflexaceae bacterium]|nr:NAD-dependent epimerase/dehydratase family protein [Chloroflexaceae bacterium]